MDIGDLLANAPDVRAGLGDLGLGDAEVDALGREAGRQLLGGDGLDLGDLLTGLTGADFLQRIDVAELARRVGIDTGIAQSALALLAPKVEAFSGGGIAGQLGSLASGLFKRGD